MIMKMKQPLYSVEHREKFHNNNHCFTYQSEFQFKEATKKQKQKRVTLFCMAVNIFPRYLTFLSYFFFFRCIQTQLSHGFPYTDRRGDYSSAITGTGGHGPRLGHEHDPLALHQALQSAVDDGQNPGMDENVGFMSELPIIKSEWSEYIFGFVLERDFFFIEIFLRKVYCLMNVLYILII